MLKTQHPKFDKMDELSQQKVPFFFMVDFLVENVLVYTENNLKENGLLVDFQNFKKCKEAYKQGYNLKFGEIGSSGENLNALQKFIEYRHKIIHVSPSLGILNQDKLSNEEPVFPTKATRERAKEFFKIFIENLHKATLTLQRNDETT